MASPRGNSKDWTWVGGSCPTCFCAPSPSAASIAAKYGWGTDPAPITPLALDADTIERIAARVVDILADRAASKAGA